MINGIIFDADGTLLDSMGFWKNTVFDIIAMAGVGEPEPGLIEKLTPMSMYEGAVYMKERYGIEMPVDELIDRENMRVKVFYKSEVTLCPGMGELVEKIAEIGLPMTVATATDREMIEYGLRRTEIIEKFKSVISCSDVGVGKESPDIFLHACNVMVTTPECTLVVDDSPRAIATAKSAGFQTYLIDDIKSAAVDILKMLQSINKTV